MDMVYAPFFILLGSVCTSKVPLYLGGLFPLTSEYRSQVLHSAFLAVEHVNSNDDVLIDYELILLANDTQDTIGGTLDSLFYQLFNPPTKIMIVGPLSSENAEVTAELTGMWNILQVSYAGSAPSLSNRAKYPYFFRTLSSMEEFNAAILTFLKQFQWEHIAVLHEIKEPFTSTSSNLLVRLAQANFSIIASESFAAKPTEQIRQLKIKDARVIVGTFGPDSANKVFCEAYKRGLYGPKYVWIIPGFFVPEWWTQGLDNLDCTEDEMRLAVDGYFSIVWATWSKDSRHSISGQTAVDFKEEITAMLNTDNLHVLLPCVYDAIWACTLALNNTILPTGKSLETFTYRDKETTDMLKEQMDHTEFLGVSGPVAFTEHGDRRGVISVEQNRGFVEVEIGRYYADTEDIVWSFTYDEIWQTHGGKSPADSDRTIFTVHLITVSNSASYMMVFLSACGVLIALGFLFFNVIHRNKSRTIAFSSETIASYGRTFALYGPNIGFSSETVVLYGPTIVFSSETVVLYGPTSVFS
ncbi:gamma-aminobutyric acid type B receptor subunit 1-like, partial [Saccoglossus kowalevskii]|uniref:Gamma-aminobutyric acid type B receptor subunit 1-like n=1 Tax=Saccoglossus kowalevskii TaxID=10224 RepID=A0ABM0LV33_SACKO